MSSLLAEGRRELLSAGCSSGVSHGSIAKRSLCCIGLGHDRVTDCLRRRWWQCSAQFGFGRPDAHREHAAESRDRAHQPDIAHPANNETRACTRAGTGTRTRTRTRTLADGAADAPRDVHPHAQPSRSAIRADGMGIGSGCR